MHKLNLYIFRIKLMLIRIGDEKRELIDQHTNVLKTKICG